MNYIVVQIKGNVEESAEDIQTTAWAKYKEKEDYTVVKVAGQKSFTETAEQIYSSLGELLMCEYLEN